ncbi:MAG: sigma 54-interacting transcriptional regulator [Thermoanaerobaculia bacterium]|nr:sigma 54-interacting transcriptional regulator [Thermoanaerobaculia bacterium]
MSAAERLDHPALAAAPGLPLERAELTDRQRLAVVLQAAGLWSLCDAAGWRPADEFAAAVVDAQGLLRGVRVEPGGADGSALPVLARLTLRLFGGGDRIAGRGEARAAARRLVERWSAVLDRGGADAAVAALLESAPFLAAAAFAPARDALAGRFTRAGREIVWRAGPREATAEDELDLVALVARARWATAVRAGRERPAQAAAHPLAFAQALWAVGKVEQALFVLEGRHDAAAETLRAEALHHLGQLGAAREAVRRLERSAPAVGERLAAGDVVLRVLAAAGEFDAARDWAAVALRDARGAERRGARLLAALAAVDRSDLDAAERLLAEAGDAAGEDPYERLAVDTRLALAEARHELEALLRLARERLARGRRRMGLARAGRAWNHLGYVRVEAGDLPGAERAYAHAARLLRRTDGPLAVTLAGFNLAEVRLRRGILREVETLLPQSMAHNRRAGNERALAEDELLAVRLDLVRGAWESAVARCRGRLAAEARQLAPSLRRRFAVLGARALGWSSQPVEARAWLAEAGDEAAAELEREELPFLFALAGDSDRAIATAGSPLALALVRGEAPPPERWRELAALEPYRRARYVLDAELLLPGAAPGELRAAAAALFRRLGAATAAAVCERSATAAWSALGRYLERPAGDRAALVELFAAVGHPEAELVVRGAAGELRLTGAASPRPELDERIVPRGDDELVLRAAGIDEPLRALAALLARDLPPTAPAPVVGASSSLTGDSGAMRAAVERLAKFASSELPVLILGENGTGKELAAVEVHRLSERRKGPWVPVNCAGLSETLLLSELFGHVRGAFTGADQPRAGVFESGRGGTVFLDEIGDLPLVAQGALLRVLQEREIRRLGESLPRKVDVRIVAATNRDLETMVEQGRFRQDLYFRLRVATVVLPPLRERGGDVLLLADRFVEEIRARGRGGELRLSPDARRALVAHAWPGNVRELRNTLEAAAALAGGNVVTPEHLDLSAAAAPAGDGDYHRQVEEFRLRLVRRALEAADGSLAGAARQLGVTRQFLSQVVRKHGLQVSR